MNYLKQLIDIETTSNKLILITTADIRTQILSYRTAQKIVDNIKIMTEHEYVSSFVFESSPNRVIFLINNSPWGETPLSIEVAKQLEKALFLIHILNLTSHDLYPYLQTHCRDDISFNEYNQPTGYQIITYLPRYSDQLQAVLNLSYKFIKRPDCEVTEFEYFLDEIETEIEGILELISQGIDLEHIHLFAPSEYHIPITQVANLFGLPIASTNQLPLLSHRDGQVIYEQLSSNQEVDLTEVDPVIGQEITNIINKYTLISDQVAATKLITYDQKNTKVTINTNGGLALNSKIDSLYTKQNFENDYFILLGNYQGGLITYGHDTNIVSDEYRNTLFTCDIQNKIEDSLFYNIISHAKHVKLSYAKRLSQATVEIANNISNATITSNPRPVNSNFSMTIDRLRHARESYTKDTFNFESKTFKFLNNHYQVTQKDNKFNGVDHQIDSLKLSYTSINDFYKCSYKYYLNHILRIKDGKFDSKKVIIGNITHYILEHIEKLETVDSQSIIKLINYYLTENKIAKSKFDDIYLTKLSNFLESVCTYVKQEERESEFTKVEREVDFEMELLPNINLIGKIDKILSKIEGDNLFVEIYDYKTGSINIDIAYIDFGLNMQNLIYFLLIKDYYKNEAGDEVLAGTYQHQLKLKQLYDDQDILDLMKIKGYSNKKTDLIFKRSEKVMTNDDFETLVDKVRGKVIDSASAITANQFEINPKIIDGKNMSCDYCQYLNICNRSYSDFQFKTKEK